MRQKQEGQRQLRLACHLGWAGRSCLESCVKRGSVEALWRGELFCRGSSALWDPAEVGTRSRSISGLDGGAGAVPIIGATAVASSPSVSPVGTGAIQKAPLGSGSGISKTSLLVPGQGLPLYVVLAPPSDQSLLPDALWVLLWALAGSSAISTPIVVNLSSMAFKN